MLNGHLKTCIAILALCLTPPVAGYGQEAIAPPRQLSPGDIRAIAAATSYEQGALFVADYQGGISYHLSSEPTRERVVIENFVPRRTGINEPLGMSFLYPDLYVFDGDTNQIWVVDVVAPGQPRAMRFRHEFQEPSHLAVSPHGLVAVIDGDRLLFLQEDMEPVAYGRERFPAPAGLSFSTWDTVHVFDARRGSLTNIKLTRLKDGRIEFLSEDMTTVPRVEGQAWQAMAVYQGIVYLANGSSIFALVESEEKPIPVVPRSDRFERISQIALTLDGLYVLDEGHLSFVPRAEPVDLILEGDAQVSQSALIGFYGYLLDLDTLPTRRVRARRGYERLEEFLFDQEVLLAPVSEGQWPELQIYSGAQVAYQNRAIAQQQMEAAQGIQPIHLPPEPDPDLRRDVICPLNPDFCAGVAPTGISQDEALIVPDLRIARSLGRERVLLDRSLESYVDDMVISHDLRDLVGPSFLKRLNPSLEELDEAEVFGMVRGSVVVPAEKWSVTAAVPAVAYEDRQSDLWDMVRRFDGASLSSKAAFVEMSARSRLLDDFDARLRQPQTHCEILQGELDNWLQRIKYPLDESGRLMEPDVSAKQVRIGVLEFRSSLKKIHQVFSLNPDRPTWYSFDLLSELVADPDPQTFQPGAQVVSASEIFSPEAHHGTHIAALIAGRSGTCWSGLLPSARLILIDLADRARVHRQVTKAIDEDVKTFNVSQTFDGPQGDLRDTILGARLSLWVVAAGNKGFDLNDMDEASVPAPVRWGWAPNVVAVTASNWDGTILESVDTPEGAIRGANRGKRYVDLVAPGKDVFAATAIPTGYGPASGTSQATPQVTAAAAMLADRRGLHMMPGDVKARLIATADWSTSYLGKVWGGRLDFGAAVMFPERGLLRTTTGAALDWLYSIEEDNDPKIKILNVPRFYERTAGDGETAPETIKFSRILSLRKRENGNFRVVFREQSTNHLKILLDARLGDGTKILGTTDKIKCVSFERYDAEQGNFVQDNGCEQGLSITQIEEFFRGGHYHIQWKEQS